MMRGLLVLVVFLLSSFSCTRNLPDPVLGLSIGMNNGQGGLAADDYLSVVIVNVKVPGKAPIVREIEYRENSAPVTMGQPITLEVKDIPNGNGFFIQVLAVYENQANGAMKFLYGDATANVNGSTTVNITADNAGSSNKMVQVAGRYLTSEDLGNSNNDAGPTGVLIAQFSPPGGKEAMTIKRSYMVNGWFQAFTIDSATAGFRYIMADGSVVFNDLKATSPALTGSLKMLKMVKPVSARRENRGDGSSIRVSAESDLFLGFFNSGSPSPPKYACYVNTTEAVPGAYNAAMTLPLIYSGISGPAINVRVGSGGQPDSFGMFGGLATNCTQAAIDGGRALLFHHFKADDEEGYSGFSVPFMSMRPLATHRSFLIGEPDVSNPAAPFWTLKWKYLPGAAAVLAGTEIWYRQNMMGGGDGGGGGEETCENLTQRGYQLAGTVPTPTQTYTFVGNGMTFDPMNPGMSNVYQFSFAACAFRMNQGVKQYLGRYAQGDCLTGNCGALDHFGWGAGDSAPPGATAFSSIGGFSQRVTGIPVKTDQYTEVDVPNNAGYTAGKEMLIVVSGATNGACGDFQGHTIQVGEFASTRLLQGTPQVRVAKGTFLDTIGTGNLPQSTTSANFCYIQMVQVPHFANLNLEGATLSPSAFDYGPDGGGIVALRVSGTLNLGGSGSSITTAGMGYVGGSTGITNGAGYMKDASSTSAPGNSGGADGAGYSGGGGYGQGGNANGTQGGMAINFGGGGGNGVHPRLVFGGGGVGGGASGAGLGNGGGIVFIMANQITSFGGAIYADGTLTNSNYSGGGGGSINVITRQLTGLGSGGVDFLARGGDGQPSGGTSFAGGGGGFVSITACNNDLSGATIFNVNGGAGGGTPMGLAGSGGQASYASTNNFWMCK